MFFFSTFREIVRNATGSGADCMDSNEELEDCNNITCTVCVVNGTEYAVSEIINETLCQIW